MGTTILYDIILSLCKAIEPLSYQDCESWGCVHSEEECAIDKAKAALELGVAWLSTVPVQ